MSLKNFIDRWITPILAMLGAFIGIVATIGGIWASQLERRLQTVQSQIDNELKVKEFNNSLKMAMYKEVKDVVAKKDSDLQEITLVAINEMLKDDTLFREKLKTVLFASPNANILIEKQKEIDKFSAEQSPTNDKSMNIDVFYLEDSSGDSYRKGRRIVAAIIGAFPSYTARLRLLPRAINAQSGYRIYATQIRFEKQEKTHAEKIRNFIAADSILGKAASIQMQQIIFRTPNYLSVFVVE